MDERKPCGCFIFDADCRGNPGGVDKCADYPKCAYGRQVKAWQRKQEQQKAKKI